mgnify:CR=1 FL=1
MLLYDSVYIRMSDRIRSVFFFQAEDGIRDLVRSRGLGDVYKRQERNIDMIRNLMLNPDVVAPDFLHDIPFDPTYGYLSLIHI